MLDYRSNPLEGIGLSPSQLLMNRRLKSTIPVKTSLLRAENDNQVKTALESRKLIQKTFYDRRSSKPLPPLEVGQRVHIQKDKNWVPATVVKKHESPRSYVEHEVY